MGKNILVLTGSPRQGGNSDILAEAFSRGARKSGHKIDLFAAGRQQISGCRACDACWSAGAPCVIPDDFRLLAPKLEKAQALVLTAPLYWFGFPAQLKAALDRMYAYLSERRQRPLGVSEAVLLICAHGDSLAAFAGAVENYRNICSYMKWRDRGVLTVTGVAARGEINGNPALEQAEKLGSEI